MIKVCTHELITGILPGQIKDTLVLQILLILGGQ